MGCVDLPWLRRNSYSPAALDGSYQKNKEFGVAVSHYIKLLTVKLHIV